jgi:ABC-2 type transport system ATP-binding protein
MTYSGLGTSRNVYAQLVDTSTGRVVGNILTPIPVKLDGKTREVSVDLEDIAYTMDPGDSLTLQIVGSATPFENFTSYGVINVSSVDLTVPTADPEAVTFEKSLRSKKPPVSAGGLLGI